MNVYKSLKTDFGNIKFCKAERRNGKLRGKKTCVGVAMYQRRIYFQYKKKKITTETKKFKKEKKIHFINFP